MVSRRSGGCCARYSSAAPAQQAGGDKVLGAVANGNALRPRVITEKLKSYGATIKELKLEVDHRQHKGLNNRAENSHQPARHSTRDMFPSFPYTPAYEGKFSLFEEFSRSFEYSASFVHLLLRDG